VSIRVASAATPDIVELLESATRAASTHRGGEQLLAAIYAGSEPNSVLADAVAHGSLWIAIDGDNTVGFALRRNGVLEAVYVKKRHRRQGLGRKLVHAVVDASDDILDAYALPGDRATKSLYESFGWKARLLTMRGE
jgi:GNAT superfamily N-acetyltransferase